MKIIIVVLATLLSGCGIYIHRGGGAYTFIGPGSYRVGERCAPGLAQWSLWNPNYDYSRMGNEKRK